MAELPEKITVDVQNIPEALYFMRREMANLLRSAAKQEDSALVARRLREIANLFETGAEA